jgi:hypothetical protein
LSKPDYGPSTKAITVNGRVYLDISSIEQDDVSELKQRMKNWRMIVDEVTGKKISHFYPTNSVMIEPICLLFYKTS